MKLGQQIIKERMQIKPKSSFQEQLTFDSTIIIIISRRPSPA